MIWDDDASLPTRDADLGIAQERAMRDVVGGYGGIRTVEWQEPDGSWARLRTRGGNPVFERDGDRVASAPAQAQRGFVAQVPGGRAVLFNPYTLDVLKTPYTPAAKPYFVESFATDWNVPAGDTTHWYDVVLFDGTTIKVNAKAMPVLQIAADHGFPAIPYLISRHDTSDQYGNAERNATEKRVFAVGRYSVKSWGGGGVVETLTPTTPRGDGKAMTIGPRVDPATSTAYLGQLFFTADSWDDIGGEWGFSAAEVAMLLTAPYLTKVSSGPNVAMPLVSFGAPNHTTGTATTPTIFPPTPFGMSANGIAPGANLPTYFNYDVDFVYSGTVSTALDGAVTGPYVRDSYSGSQSSTSTYAGVTIDYNGANVVEFDVRDEHNHYNDATVNYPSGARWNNTDDTLFMYGGGSFSWESGGSGGFSQYRGKTTESIIGDDVPGSFVSARTYQTQTGSFNVLIGSTSLVAVALSRSKSSGNKATIYPASNFYDPYMGDTCNPHGVNTSGMGIGGHVAIVAFNAFAPPGGYTWGPENTELDRMLTAYKSQTYFEDVSSSGVPRTASIGAAYYTATQSSVTEDESVLTWSTKDYLLYDTTNGVYISVEGYFAGANTSAALSVILRVKTRGHDVVQNLHDSTYSGQVLPEVLIDTGRYAIPSPQIRAIFAPPYCEQGSFKGAHYVTLAEETNGATPFHGFNFLLNLQMYGDIATCNEDNAGRDVFFVPCNLLEMLYAFVFSQKYGVAESGERYPVTFTARFNAMRDSLFTTPFRVAIRNGVDGAWTDSFGADFASVPNVSLWRT